MSTTQEIETHLIEDIRKCINRIKVRGETPNTLYLSQPALAILKDPFKPYCGRGTSKMKKRARFARKKRIAWMQDKGFAIPLK